MVSVALDAGAYFEIASQEQIPLFRSSSETRLLIQHGHQVCVCKSEGKRMLQPLLDISELAPCTEPYVGALASCLGRDIYWRNKRGGGLHLVELLSPNIPYEL